MSTYSPYSGRLGKILDDVWTEYNAEADFGKAGTLLTTQLLVSLCNRCTVDLAQSEIWTKETAFDAVAGQASYNLLTEIPDLVCVDKIFWKGTDGYSRPMGKIRTWSSYKQAAACSGGLSVVPSYFLDGNTLWVWPTPTANATDAIEVRHSYLPSQQLGGISYLNNAAVTNIGGGVVNIAATNHGYSVGQTVTIYGTVHYNGAEVLQTGTDPNNLRILATYSAETIPATAYAIGTLNETPLVPVSNDEAYVYFCLMRLASKDYAGENYSDKLHNRFAMDYRIQKAKAIQQTIDLTQLRGPR